MMLKILDFAEIFFVVKLTKRVEEYDKRIHWSNGVGRNKLVRYKL